MKIHRLLGLAAVGLLGTAARLAAQDVEFAGTVYGCFFTTPATSCIAVEPPPIANVSAIDLGPGGSWLQYTADSFDGTTFLGSVGFADGGGGSTGSFGHVTVFGDFVAPANDYLQLKFEFSLPTAPTTFYSAAVTGAISGTRGNIKITFGDPISFAFISGGVPGVAELSINPLNLGDNATDIPVTGEIDAAITATPEPGSWVLLGTGMLGLIPVVRYARRKRA